MSAALAVDFASSSEPIARQVARALRQAIVRMEIRPGEMLSEQDIATKLGVSRQPVREAFIKLGEAGLLRILPQRGTLVVKISQAAVEDARFIREAVECAVAREAAGRADGPGIAALEDSLLRQRRALRAKNGGALFALDEEFHRLLAEAAGRPSAWSVVEDVKPQMDRVRYLDMADAIPMSVVITQHTHIVDAVKAGDAPAAEAAMRAHLTEILRSLPKVAARHPELFE
jgi:DNA-binding GntR family transcriptional regulator